MTASMLRLRSSVIGTIPQISASISRYKFTMKC